MKQNDGAVGVSAEMNREKAARAYQEAARGRSF